MNDNVCNFVMQIALFVIVIMHLSVLLWRCTVWTDKYIVTGSDDGYVMLFDFTLGEVVHRFKAHDGMSVML